MTKQTVFSDAQSATNTPHHQTNSCLLASGLRGSSPLSGDLPPYYWYLHEQSRAGSGPDSERDRWVLHHHHHQQLCRLQRAARMVCGMCIKDRPAARISDPAPNWRPDAGRIALVVPWSTHPQRSQCPQLWARRLLVMLTPCDSGCDRDRELRRRRGRVVVIFASFCLWRR